MEQEELAKDWADKFVNEFRERSRDCKVSRRQRGPKIEESDRPLFDKAMLVTTEEELEFLQLIPFQLHGLSVVFHLVLADSEFTRLAIARMMSACVVFIGRRCAAAAGGTSRKAQGPYLLSTMVIPQLLASRSINRLASFPPQSLTLGVPLD
jgi:hypothetical protein